MADSSSILFTRKYRKNFKLDIFFTFKVTILVYINIIFKIIVEMVN